MSVLDDLIKKASESREQSAAQANPFLNGYKANEQKVWSDRHGNVNITDLGTGVTRRHYDSGTLEDVFGLRSVNPNKASPTKDSYLQDTAQALADHLHAQRASYKSALGSAVRGIAGLVHGDNNYQPEVGSWLWRMQEGYEAEKGVSEKLREDSKYGKGWLHGLAMDLTGGAVDLAGDRVLDLVLPGAGLVAMDIRSFGDSAGQSQVQGKSISTQMLNGAIHAAIGHFAEKAGTTVGRGKGTPAWGERLSSAIEGRLEQKGASKLVQKLIMGFGEEAAEEMLEDVLNPAVSKFVAGIDKGDYDAEEFPSLAEIAYDGLVGGLLGLMGGATEGIAATRAAKNGTVEVDVPVRENGESNTSFASRVKDYIKTKANEHVDTALERAAEAKRNSEATSSPTSQMPQEAQMQSAPAEIAPEAPSAVKPQAEELNTEPEAEQQKPKRIGEKTGRDIAWSTWFGDETRAREAREAEGVTVDASDFTDEGSTTEPESGKVETRKTTPTAAERLANYNNPQTIDVANRGLKGRVESAVRNALAQNGIDYSDDPRSEYYDESTGEYREEDVDLLDEESRAKYQADMKQIRLLDAVDEWLDKNGQRYLSAKKGSEAEIQQGLQNALNDYVRRYLDSQTDKTANSEAVEDVMQQRRQDDKLKSLAKEEKQEAPTGYNTVQVGDNLFRVTGPGGITTTEVADNSADAVQKHIDGLTEENRKKAKERKAKEQELKKLRQEVQESQENPKQIEGSDGKLYEVTKELTRGENNYQYVVTELDEDGLPTDMEARIFRKNATNEEEAVQHAIEHPEYFNDGSVEGENWGEGSSNEKGNVERRQRENRYNQLAFDKGGVGRAQTQNERKISAENPILRQYRESSVFDAFPEVDYAKAEWGDNVKVVAPKGWQVGLTDLVKRVTGARVYWATHDLSDSDEHITEAFVTPDGDIFFSSTLLGDGSGSDVDPLTLYAYFDAAHEVVHHLVNETFITGEKSGKAKTFLEDIFRTAKIDKASQENVILGEANYYFPDPDALNGLTPEQIKTVLREYMRVDPDFASLVYSETIAKMAGSCDLHLLEGESVDNYDLLRTLFDTAREKLISENLIDGADLAQFPDFDIAFSIDNGTDISNSLPANDYLDRRIERLQGDDRLTAIAAKEYLLRERHSSDSRRNKWAYAPKEGKIDVSDESRLSDVDKAIVKDSKEYLGRQDKAMRRFKDGERSGWQNMHGDKFEDGNERRWLRDNGAWIDDERDGHLWFDIDNAREWIAEEELKRLDEVANFRGNINDRNTGYYMMLDVTRSLARQKLLEAEIAEEESRREHFEALKAEEVKQTKEPSKAKEKPKVKSGAEVLAETAQKNSKPEADEPTPPKRSAPPSDLNETLNEMSRERDAKAKAKDADFEAKRAEDKQQTNAKEYAYNKKLEAEEAGTESSDEDKAKSTFGDGYDKVQKSAEDFGKIKTRFDEDAFKESGKKQDKATRNKLGKLRELFTNAATTGDVESLFSFYESLKDDPNLSNFYNEDVQEDIDNFRKLVDENLDTYNEGAAPYAAARTMQKMAHKFAKANEYQQTLKKMNETLRGSKNGILRKIGKSDKLTASIARALMRWQINPDTVFKMIDAFDKGSFGEGYKLAKELQTAHREKYNVLMAARARFDDAKKMKNYEDFIYGKQKVKDYSGREWDMRSALSVVKAIDTIRSTSGKKLGGTDGFGVMDSKGNIEYIDMSDVDAVKLYESLKSGLSDVAIKFGDIANDAFNDVKEPLRKKFKDINGVDIQMIGDIDRRLGDKKGIEKAVYSPLSYVDKNGNTYQFDIAKQDTYNNIPRFLRERSENGGTYLLIKPYTEVTGKYFEQVSNYLAYSEFNEKMRGLAKGSKYESGLGNTLAEVFGKDMGNWYKSYVEDLSTYQNEDDVEGVNSLLRQGRQRLQQGALLFSVSVPMKQISSYWAASGILHPDSLIQAYRIKLLKPKNGSDAATMLASRAMGNLEQSAAEAAKDAEKWLGKLKYSSKFIKMAANAINQMDYNTVSNLLTATEYDVLKYQFNNDTSKIGTEEFNQAVEELFQDVVDRSQPNFDKQMRAEYGRTDNEIVRMLSMFRTQQTQNLNLLATAIGEYQASKGTANQAKATETLKQTIAGQAASAFSLSMLTILADMLLHRQKKYEDEETEELDMSKVLTRLGINAIEASSGTMWFGDTIAKWAIDRISGGKTKEFYGVNMGVISTVSDILENFENVMKNPTRSNIRYCAGNIATLLGVPLNNAYSMLNSAIMYGKDVLGSNDGDYDDILKYLDAQTKAAKKAEEKAAKEAAKQAEKSGASLLADIANNKYGKGNIDLTDRNTGLYDEDGNIMTVKSMSFEEDGKEILVPTIVKKNGKWVELSDKEAIDWYHKTGEYLGKFNSVKEANKYAEQLHQQQAKMYGSQSELNSAEEQKAPEVSTYLKKPYNALVEAGMTPERSQYVLDFMDTDNNDSIKQSEMWAFYKDNPDYEDYVIAMWNSYGYKTTWEAYKAKHK